MVPVFSCFVRSLELKCEACNSKTRYLQAQPATPRAMWHPRPLAEDVPCKKASWQILPLSITVDEIQLISWARTNRPKNWKRPTRQFRSWSSKSQKAKIMDDLLQPTEIALRRSSSSSVTRLYARLDPGSKAWVNNQDLPFAWFLLVDFSLAIAIDDATGHTRSGAKKYRTQSRKKVSGRRFKTRSVGLVEAETFFCLALLHFFFFFTQIEDLVSLSGVKQWRSNRILFQEKAEIMNKYRPRHAIIDHLWNVCGQMEVGALLTCGSGILLVKWHRVIKGRWCTARQKKIVRYQCQDSNGGRCRIIRSCYYVFEQCTKVSSRTPLLQSSSLPVCSYPRCAFGSTAFRSKVHRKQNVGRTTCNSNFRFAA